MAGSRLFLQASVLLELLLLIYVAIEWGLCPSNDRVCLLLIPNKQQTGRELIEKTTEFPSELYFVPRLTIVVSSSRKTVHTTTTTNSGDVVEFKTHEALRNKLCDRNTELDEISAFLSQSDQPHVNLESTVWICDPLLLVHDNNPTSSSLGRVQVKSGVTLLYPSTDDVSVETLLGALLPTRSKRSFQSRPRLKVVLALEETNEWQTWAMALAEYVENETMHSPHACWKDPIQFQVDPNVHLSSNLKKTVTTDESNNQTIYKMPAASLHDTFLRKRQHNDEYLHIVLYVPDSTPLLVFDETGTESSSKAFTSDKDDVIAILDQTSLEGSDRVEILRDVWVYVNEFLSKQCYQMTPIHDDELLEMDHPATTTTIFPAWQHRLWLQRILQDSYNLATMELSKQRHMLLNLPSTVFLARDHVASQEWKLAEAGVQEALLHAANEEWWKALDSLEQAAQRLHTLERDPTLREPLDLLPQHYMAVFAPLLFPLLLPFVAGVIREFKRYRKLQSAKKKE